MLSGHIHGNGLLIRVWHLLYFSFYHKLLWGLSLCRKMSKSIDTIFIHPFLSFIGKIKIGIYIYFLISCTKIILEETFQ